MSLRNGVFSLREIEDEKILKEAVSIAEHRHQVRQMLFRNGNTAQKNSKRSSMRSKNVMGLLGYDQLQLKPLARVEVKISFLIFLWNEDKLILTILPCSK